MSQAAIATAIKALLDATQTAGSFYDDVSGNIRWLLGVQNADLPLFTYQFIGDVPDQFFDNTEPRDLPVQFDLYTDRNDGPDAHDATKAKAVALLNNQTLTVTGFGLVELWITDRGQQTVEDNATRTTMTATLKAQ